MNNAPATANTFLGRLRANTAVSHTKLEELPISKSVISPDITTNDYLFYLDLMHDVVKQAEAAVFPKISTIITDLNERKKTPLLEKDMAFLGLNKTVNKTPLGDTSGFSPAFALGIMYVIEGSTLGGRVILKNINEALGYDADNGASFFSGYGNHTGSMWKKFLSVMESYEGQNNCADEIIKGADFAFNAISRHFTQKL